MSKIMKRLISILFVMMLMVPAVVYAGESKNVIDMLGYLTDDEIDNLQGTIEDITDEYQMEPVIVITDNTEGKSSMAYADDYYDYNGYGVGSNKSGLLMLINMNAREVWISTTGDAISAFSDARISKMVDKITPYLSDGDYNKACETFLELIPPTSYGKGVVKMLTNGIVYIVALVIAIIVVIALTLSRKGKVTINNMTYEEQGSFVLTNQQDIFLRETVTKTKIETSSGGSSTHSGSSGTSHGGGGGKF